MEDNPQDFFDYGGGNTRTATWNWKEDFALWSQDWGNGYFSVPTTPSDASGRFWAHGETEVGEVVDIGTGLHPAPNSADDKTRMANAYSALAPIQESSYYYIKKAQTPMLPPFYSHFCPECPIAAVPSVGTECPQCGAVAWIKDHTGPWEAQILVQLDAVMGGHVGVLRHDGTVQVVTDRIGSALQASLRSDAVWAPSAEPSPSIGRGLIMPAAVGLSPDGTALRERVYQNGPSLLGDGDFVDRPIDVVRTTIMRIMS